MIETFLAEAYCIARQSRDPSSQNGAVLVSSTGEFISNGNNNFPVGVEFTEERATERPKKYRYFEHAERYALFNAARGGSSDIYGSTMYCPWAACCDCARAIICMGVQHLVMHQERMDMTPERWVDDVNEALTMMAEAGVELHYHSGPINNAPRILANGELWDPADPPVKESGNWFVGMGT